MNTTLELVLSSLEGQGCEIRSENDVHKVTYHGRSVCSINSDEVNLPVAGDNFGNKEKDFPLNWVDDIIVSDKRIVVKLVDGRIFVVLNPPLTPAIVDTNLLDQNLLKQRWTLSAAIDLGPTIAPMVYDCLWLNLLTMRAMVDMRLFGQPDLGDVPLDDSLSTELEAYIQRKMIGQGYSHVLPDTVYKKFERNIISRNSRNPFLDRISETLWDGTPRVRSWFIRYFGASAPQIREKYGEEEERRYLEEVSLRWFMGGIARNVCPKGHLQDIVPVLIGPQGCGKSSALRFTGLGNEEDEGFYGENIEGIADLDKFRENVSGKVVVELAEAEILKSASNNKLKGFISQQTDRARLPYDKHPTEMPRRYVMAITSNFANIFTDSSGNRRYFPIHCWEDRERDFDLYDVPISEAEQVWAEALYLYTSGETVYWPRSMKPLSDFIQEAHSYAPVNAELVDCALDRNEDSNFIGAKLFPEEVLSIAYGYTVTGPLSDKDDLNLKRWAKHTKSWEYVPGSKCGISRRLYRRIHFSNDEEDER